MFNSNIWPNVDHFQDKTHFNPGDLNLTSRSQVKSNLTQPFERPDMTSYKCLIVIFALMSTVFKIKPI